MFHHLLPYLKLCGYSLNLINKIKLSKHIFKCSRALNSKMNSILDDGHLNNRQKRRIIINTKKKKKTNCLSSGFSKVEKRQKNSRRIWSQKLGFTYIYPSFHR